MAGIGKGGVKEFHAAKTTAVASSLRREERGRVEEPGVGATGPCRCWRGNARAPSPWVPAARSQASTSATASLPDPAAHRRPRRVSAPSRPGTRARSPDAPAAAPRCVSGASLQPGVSARSADSRGAGPAGRGGAPGQRAGVPAGGGCSEGGGVRVGWRPVRNKITQEALGPVANVPRSTAPPPSEEGGATRPETHLGGDVTRSRWGLTTPALPW